MNKPNTFQELSASKGFKIAHLNVRSLPKKVDQIRLLMSQSEIDILTLSETWLKSHLHQNLVALDNYSSHRLDRSNSGRKKKRGGGLITYIHDKHSSVSESLDELNMSGENLEVQWVLVHRPHSKMLSLEMFTDHPAETSRQPLLT